MPPVTDPLPAGPSYHYYRAPYPILSFLYGLYCDLEWSVNEYEKWEDAGKDPATGTFRYLKYLDPYPNIPANAFRVLTLDVANLPKPDDDPRRKPRLVDCESLWPDLKAELARPPRAKEDGRPPQFKDIRPILSSVACIFLGDVSSLAQVVDQAAARLLPVSVLESLIKTRGTDESLSLIEELRPRLFSEFIAPKNSW